MQLMEAERPGAPEAARLWLQGSPSFLLHHFGRGRTGPKGEGAGEPHSPAGAGVGVAGPRRPLGGHGRQPPPTMPCDARQDVDMDGSSRLIYYLIKGSRHRWWTASGRAGAWGREAGGWEDRRPEQASTLDSGAGRIEESGLLPSWQAAFLLPCP